MKLKYLFLAAAAALATAAAAQDISDEAKATVLDAITKNVKERAYVGGVDFSKWDTMVASHKDEFNKAKTHDQFALAVNKALNEFGFSHMQLLTPRSAQTRTTGKSVGIGVMIEPDARGIRIVRVIPGGPAEKAGLKPGDVIIKADGVPVDGPERVRGPKDSKVIITVLRDEKEEIEVPIVRAEFTTLVKDELKWLDDKTVMLRINSFATGYDQKAVDAMLDEAQRANRLIIDLRTNGGGAVPNLLHLAGRILPKGTTIGKFITRSHADEYLKENPGASDDPVMVAKKFGWELMGSPGKNKRYEGDVVVLISGGSASASEIFAAAVHDSGRGRIVGTKSAGAVLASVFANLPEGFSLQIPMMEYVTPKGIRLEGNGVAPDFAVEANKIGDDDACLKVAMTAFDAIKKGSAKPPQ